MREIFGGFYQPTDDEFKAIWNEGTFVLDANVLLDLYRLPARSREDLFGVLEKIGARLWIPYQFGLEFHRNRILVINETEAAVSEVLSTLTSKYGDVERSVNKTGLDIDVDKHLLPLKDAIDALRKTVEAAKQTKADGSIDEEVRRRLEKLLAGRIGPAPLTEQDMAALVLEADDRYNAKIPPGFKDVDKDKHPDGPTFHHRGIEYRRKWGDLIAWRQIINFANASNTKVLTFVTSDVKDDWWWREKGRTQGPLPELHYEITSNSPVVSFWMYSLPRFLELSKVYLNTVVSSETITDAKNLGERTRRSSLPILDPASISAARRKIAVSLKRFIQQIHPNYELTSEPDDNIFVYVDEYYDVIVKYDVISPKSLQSEEELIGAIMKNMSDDKIERGPYKEIRIFLIAGAQDEDGLDRDLIRRQLDIFAKHSISHGEIYVGTVTKDGYIPFV